MEEKITPEDLERVQLLHIVSKRGFKDLSLEKIKRLQFLVKKKDYSHNKKTRRSKMKLLAQINVAVYEREEKK
ncbi:MAG: hypothetical protein V3T67_04500 [Nitrosopumilaceae archaeon]